MIVVADTSPFVVLANIGHVDLFPALFTRVVVPPEVIGELKSSGRPEPVRSWAAALPPWIDVQAPARPEPIEGLHPGESAAIALALELNADRLVIDERHGRRAAVERGIPTVGTIGVLIAAAQRRMLDLEQAFQRIKQTDFWVTAKFLDERLTAFREWERDQSDP